MVIVAAQFGQVAMDVNIRVTLGDGPGHGLDLFQRGPAGRWRIGEDLAGLVEDLDATVEQGQLAELAAAPLVQVEFGEEGLEFGDGLALQHVEQASFESRVQPRSSKQAAEQADMTEIQRNPLQRNRAQGLDHQADDLDIGLDAGMAEQFGTELQGSAVGVQAVGTGVQQVTAVAETGNRALLGQLVRVDTRHLGRHVATHPEQAPAVLVHQGKGLLFQRVSRAGEQRITELHHRRHHQIVAPAVVELDQPGAQLLDSRGIGRQQFLNAIGQQPAVFGDRHLQPRIR